MGRKHHKKRSLFRSLKKLLKKPQVHQILANAAVQFLTAAASIIAYYFLGGLISSVIAALIVLPTSLALVKLSGYKIEPLQYVALFFLTVFGLPSIFLDNAFLAKIQEPISGLLMGLGFSAISLWMNTPVIKTVVPEVIKNIPFLNRHIFSKSDVAWKRIDYLWSVEMTLSAALSMAAVFLFSTDIWFIAKYTIGPVLTVISMSITGMILYLDPVVPPLAQADIGQEVHHPAPEAGEPKPTSPLLTVVYDASLNSEQADQAVVAENVTSEDKLVLF
jgi:intracellular septation protein A